MEKFIMYHNIPYDVENARWFFQNVVWSTMGKEHTCKRATPSVRFNDEYKVAEHKLEVTPETNDAWIIDQWNTISL